MTALYWLRAMPLHWRDKFAADLPWHLIIAVNDAGFMLGDKSAHGGASN